MQLFFWRLFMNKESFGTWISLIYRYGQTYISKELKEYNIGRGQYIFLIALYKKDGISQEQLTDYLKIGKCTTARAIKKLEENKYIIRKQDLMDKRAYKVYLTEKAYEVKPVIDSILEEWADILSLNFTEDEENIAVDMFERMANNAAEKLELKN